jgi:chorismate mutase
MNNRRQALRYLLTFMLYPDKETAQVAFHHVFLDISQVFSPDS